jgi:hypothetical protein
MDADAIHPKGFYWVSTPKGKMKIVVIAHSLTMADSWQCRLPEGNAGIVVFRSCDFLRSADD